MKLNYQIENPHDSEKPWLVLINGLFAALNSWDQSIKELTQDFRVLRYDCRGQGLSPRPAGPYTLDQHTSDLKELLDVLNISQCFLIGISNGGRIALKFSTENPKIVLAQVVADTYDQVNESLRIKLQSWKSANQIGGGQLRFEVASPWIWGETFLQNNSKLYHYYKENAGNESTDVVNSLIDGALTGDINIERIKAPTLVLVGKEDLLTPPSLHESFYKKIDNGKLEIIAGGHASLLEYPQTMTTTVIPYIKEYI